MDSDPEIPFRSLLEHKYPEVYEYIKNAVRMLHRQQSLLAKITNSSLTDSKKSNARSDRKIENVKSEQNIIKDDIDVKNSSNENSADALDNVEHLANNNKKCKKQDDESFKITKTEIKEEGECSEDEEKNKDLNQIDQYCLGKSRFILEETTGMYYDQVTGYYYNLDNGLFYDGNQGCYYYFDVIAQKYRLHSQVHTDIHQLSSNVPKADKQHKNQDMPESISEDSDSDNSEDSGNLVIKEDTEEDNEKNDKEIKEIVLNTVEKMPEKFSKEKDEIKQESSVENSDTKDISEEVKSEHCPPPPTTCEILDKRYLNLLQYTKLLPAPKNIVHKLTPDGVNQTGKPFEKLAQQLTYVICRVKQNNMHK
uniref:Angiogenic factor with G patch and FHA domains 1 n=1 Tax=Sipha flava TaxID=143950 RepID=A0A2S2Q6A5_9HEMI